MDDFLPNFFSKLLNIGMIKMNPIYSVKCNNCGCDTHIYAPITGDTQQINQQFTLSFPRSAVLAWNNHLKDICPDFTITDEELEKL